MKGVILAAGAGKRLRSLAQGLPKPLLSVLGRPLIDYTIEAFAHAGFTRLGVVVGYKGDLLCRYLDDGNRYGLSIRCLYNTHYWRGNVTSILASQGFVNNRPFVVSMADHMISSRVLKHLLDCPVPGHTLCVDRRAHAPPQINDATRVWVDERGLVARIGKGLARWNAVDAGVFLFDPRIFRHIAACVRNDVCSITRTLRWMIAGGDRLSTCDVSGMFWLDVDTPEDLRYARAAVARRVSDAGSDLGPSPQRRRSSEPAIRVRRAPGAPAVAGPADA